MPDEPAKKRRLQSATERDAESERERARRAREREREREIELEREAELERDLSGEGVPDYDNGEDTGQVSLRYDDEAERNRAIRVNRARRPTDKRFEKIEDKQDQFEKSMTEVKVVVAKISGQLEVLPRLIDEGFQQIHAASARDHVTFTSKIEVDTAAAKSEIELAKAAAEGQIKTTTAEHLGVIETTTAEHLGVIETTTAEHLGVIETTNAERRDAVDARKAKRDLVIRIAGRAIALVTSGAVLHWIAVRLFGG